MTTHPAEIESPFSTHALDRMNARRLTRAGVDMVQRYGREVFARGAVYQFIGRKEVEAYADQADLSDLEGVHVLLAHDGTVITAYRNRRFRPREYRKPNYRQWMRHKGRRRGR